MSRDERIEKERIEFNEWKSTISCYGNPNKGDRTWNVIMDGPSDSPYMGGKFKIQIYFPDNYPSQKPDVLFKTPICHININGEHICISSLNEYNQNYSIVDILNSIFMMLTSPNEYSAYSTYKNLYINNYTEYLAKARQMTREYAKI